MSDRRSVVKELGILLIGLGVLVPLVLGLYLLLGGTAFRWLGTGGLIAVALSIGATYAGSGIALLVRPARPTVIAAMSLSIVVGVILLPGGIQGFGVGVLTIVMVSLRGTAALKEVSRSKSTGRNRGSAPQKRRRPRPVPRRDDDEYDE